MGYADRDRAPSGAPSDPYFRTPLNPDVPPLPRGDRRRS